MRDPAFAGNCLRCGKSCYGQSHCEACSDWDGKTRCESCDNEFEAEGPLKECVDHFFLVDRKLQEEYLGDLRGEVEDLKAALKRRDEMLARLDKSLKEASAFFLTMREALQEIQTRLAPDEKDDSLFQLAASIVRLQWGEKGGNGTAL